MRKTKLGAAHQEVMLLCNSDPTYSTMIVKQTIAIVSIKVRGCQRQLAFRKQTFQRVFWGEFEQTLYGVLCTVRIRSAGKRTSPTVLNAADTCCMRATSRGECCGFAQRNCTCAASGLQQQGHGIVAWLAQRKKIVACALRCKRTHRQQGCSRHKRGAPVCLEEVAVCSTVGRSSYQLH